MISVAVTVAVIIAVNLLSLAAAFIIAGIKGRPYRLLDDYKAKALIYAGAIGILVGRAFQ